MKFKFITFTFHLIIESSAPTLHSFYRVFPEKSPVGAKQMTYHYGTHFKIHKVLYFGCHLT